MVESPSFTRLSVEKAAYADLSRAACRKSGVVLGGTGEPGTVPPGTAENAPGRQSWVSLGFGEWLRAPRTTSWVILSRPYGTVQGPYFYPGLASWATFSRPYGTELVCGVLAQALPGWAPTARRVGGSPPALAGGRCFSVAERMATSSIGFSPGLPTGCHPHLPWCADRESAGASQTGWPGRW
jgi:hypothetical protein